MQKKFEFPEIEIVKFETTRVLLEDSGWWDDFDDPNGGEIVTRN